MVDNKALVRDIQILMLKRHIEKLCEPKPRYIEIKCEFGFHFKED